MLRYFEHKLYLRKMAWGLIGILSGIEVNLPALRMVGNLVARRIDPVRRGAQEGGKTGRFGDGWPEPPNPSRLPAFL